MTTLREHLSLLYDYTCWANDRVLALSKDLPAAEYARERPYGRGSLRDILVHLYVAEWRWRRRFEQGGLQGDPPVIDRLQSPADLELEWAPERERWRAFLAGLDPDRIIEYLRSDGTPDRGALGPLIAHVFNHATQHRAEAAWILTELGRFPGDLDLIVYLRTEV
ncbi:MAG: damage-inducible protein DinB [Dehalococcoidia bacterium]|nr:MAG: damage-inducible protein DinB [Dehalococcoidia bacterium]